MAKACGITRERQDALAHRSHQRTAQAWSGDKLKEEVITALILPYKQPLIEDNDTRDNPFLVGYTKLRPAFDRKHGMVTVANSTPLIDGAAAVILMTGSWAKELGSVPLGYLRSYASTAVDVQQGMLLNLTWPAPLALKRARLTMSDPTLIDMYKAFAAQALINIQLLGNEHSTRDVLGRAHTTGEVDESRFNMLGGSVACGHPFTVTGTRMITQTLYELHHRGDESGLVTACIAGGLGVAMALEAE